MANESTRTVIVAGGTGALGAAVARAFLATGANVAVTYRSREEFDALRAEPGAANLTGADVDVTNEAATRKFVEGVARERGSLDALVITVGGYAGGKNVWEADAATFDAMINLNLRAAWTLARVAAPIMIKRNRGAIVNVASRAAYGSSPGAALYAASKAAVLALWASLADELKAHNINVNSVVPSIMDTPANRRAMPKANFNVWPKTEDVAKVILFLCSPDAKLIQGAAIPVYGQT